MSSARTFSRSTLLIGAVLLGFTAMAAATSCDPMMAASLPAFEMTFEVHGRNRVERKLLLPPQTEVLILAKERGIDATLEITSAGKVIARTDSPIRRTGIQRVNFRVNPNADYAIAIIGGESAAKPGQVEVRALSYATAPATDLCLQVQVLLARADSAYAAADAAVHGLSGSKASDAPAAYQSAADRYKTAIAKLEASGLSLLLAQAQHALASVQSETYDAADSILMAAKAARTYDALAEKYGSAQAVALQAMALMSLAQSPSQSAPTAASTSPAEMLARARALLTSVVGFHAQRGESYEQGIALTFIGLAYYSEGLNDEAIGAYTPALHLFQDLADAGWQAKVLQNIALSETEMGRLSQALARYERVLKLISRADDPLVFAIVLNNSAYANRVFGNADVALRQYGEALDLTRSLHDAYFEAQSLHGVGSVYEMMGDGEVALDYYRQALALRRTELDGPGRTASLRAVGNILREHGNAAEALAMHREALSLAVTPFAINRIRVQVAKDYRSLGKLDEAMKELETILAKDAASDEMQRAYALLERGDLRISTGMLPAAEADLRSALATFRKYEAPADEFSAWEGLARLERKRGASDRALAALDEALALIEEIRAQTANPELRATVMQPFRPAFDLKISILAEQYFNVSHGEGARDKQAIAMQALMTAEQARVRALADFRRTDISAPGLDSQRGEQRRLLYKELAARRFQLEARLDKSGTTDARVRQLREEIAALRQQLDRINGEIGAASALTVDKLATHRSVEVRPIDLRGIPDDTAIVEYWLGTERAIAWVLTREQLDMTDLGSAARVNDAARTYHEALRSFGSVDLSERLKAGATLHHLIVSPVSEIISSKRTLLFAPDGVLHYAPFAALRSSTAASGRFLVETHDVAVIPSVRILLDAHRGRAHAPTKNMLLVNDPVYGPDDSRLARSGATTQAQEKQASRWPLNLFREAANTSELRRLPATAEEASAIVSLLPPSEVDRLEGFAATRDGFLKSELDRYRFIHVASHAVADSEFPQLSALILSTRDREGREIDGRVMAADFMHVHLSADAVILSGCDTALGKSVVGEGLIGLRYVVLARGARAVIGSLWPVPDQATAQLMVRFYSSLLRERASVATASSEAMRAMIAGQFNDPSVWAAFTATISEL
jgi:CHAT domain-containing protein/tetratricopeptide (TPR) repeat protein